MINEFNGVGNFRINGPYLSINDPDLELQFVPVSDYTFQFNEENLKDVNIIVYHKYIPQLRTQQELNEFIRLRQKYGFKLIYDIDDYWMVDDKHPNYSAQENKNNTTNTIQNIQFADYVTTTTPIFADEIKKYNPNVIVLENAVNTKESQWRPNKIKSDKTRFLWGGGITHLQDLQLLNLSLDISDTDFLNKSQIYMCGYDLRMRDPKTGSLSIDNPAYSIWTKFEKIFTNNYRSIKNPVYLKWVKEYVDNGENEYGYNEEFKDEFYQRRWSKPIFRYGTMYNETDVALSPLTNTYFNNMKSQLKVIEAGAHKCPIISSNTGPYTIDIIDGKNGFLIDQYNKSAWFDKMKFFSENPNAVEDMGESLYELVMEKYTLEKVNIKRVQFLKSIV